MIKVVVKKLLTTNFVTGFSQDKDSGENQFQ